MLRSRYFLVLLALSASVAPNVHGQDQLLQRIRSRMENRAAQCSGCGAAQISGCSCQDCPPAQLGGSPNYSPMTGAPGAHYGTPAYPEYLINQPGANGQPGMGQPIDPNMGAAGQPNGLPPITPGMNPNVPGAQPNLGGNGQAPAFDPNAGQAFGGQDGGDDFSASLDFASSGEMSGVRDLTIGDFFSGSGAVTNDIGEVSTIPIAGGDRRRKITDHFSPIPVNRTYFSYHGFGDAVTDLNGNETDVQRFSFGLERMFMDNNASFEIRLPFVHGLDSTQIEDGSPNSATGTEFGNLTLATKLLLVRRQNYAVSAGVSSILPTAGDGALQDSGGGTFLSFDNKAVDIVPFLSLYMRPNSRSWVTLTTQLDFNLKGNDVTLDPGTTNEQTGRFNDQNLFGMDMTMGRWFWTDNGQNGRLINGIAGIFELHYTTTTTDSDVVVLQDFTISNPFNRTDTLNSTAGLRFQVRNNTYATFAAVFPLRGGEDRPFETEFNFNISRVY